MLSRGYQRDNHEEVVIMSQVDEIHRLSNASALAQAAAQPDIIYNQHFSPINGSQDATERSGERCARKNSHFDRTRRDLSFEQ